MLIYLCDFVHDYLGVSTAMFPLNIGYLASYCNKYSNIKQNIKLFKYPSEFVKAMQNKPADICGFANYVWNNNLNINMAKMAYNIRKDVKIIFGGSNIDVDMMSLCDFIMKNPFVDKYSTSRGEQEFLNFVNYTDSQPNDLDSIPSPYLAGTLDKFFNTKLIPIIETNRGCCYSCTFCTQGIKSGNKIKYFSIDRVEAEIDYIAARCKNTPLLQIADSNFGIHERDIEIAKYIAEVSKKTGYPRKVNTNWAKANPKIYEISSILNDSGIVISLQSLDPNVLKAVKRVNLPLPSFQKIADEVNKRKGISGTEIILGLPEETKRSHLAALKMLFDMKISYISCYNALILKGSEMSQQRKSGEFVCKTKFRLSDTCFGKYNDKYVFDVEEGVRETKYMTEEEILFFRPIHWLIQFMWNYGYYHELLEKIQSYGINPVDFIANVVIAGREAKHKAIYDLFNDFDKEAKGEWFDTEKELHSFYVKNFKKLEAGEYGKLNGKYIFKVLLECKTEFSLLLFDVSRSFDEIKDKTEIIQLIEKANDRMIDFFKLDTKRLSNKKLQSIKKLMKQYKHKNKNLMLRKMSEYMSIRDFFYEK